MTEFDPGEYDVTITRTFDAPHKTWKRLLELIEEQRTESEGEED